MDSRKILVLLSNKSEAQSCVNFTVQLFREMKTLMVIAYVEESDFSETEKQMTAADIQQSFNAHPNVKVVVRNGKNLTTDDIAREAKYTDLIVLQTVLLSDASNQWLNAASKYQNDALAQVPVIVVPNRAHKIEEVLITYDGENPNFGSIRQFCQVMGGFCSMVNVTLLEINHGCSHFLPEEEKLMVEYLKEHCQNFGVYKVSEESPEKILQLINCGPNALVVSGTLSSLQASLPHLPSLTGKFIQEKNMAGFFGTSIY